jgi:hypothetical protein
MEKRGQEFMKFRKGYFEIAGMRFGYEFSRIGHNGVPYLDRHILHIGGPSLRLHKFHRGDDDRAPHDHPWNFWTFPLATYVEQVPYRAKPTRYPSDDFWGYTENVVKAFRFHFRKAEYLHVVSYKRAKNPEKPFWTFVVTGSVKRKWGFWPKPGKFVYWRDWT